MLFHTLWACFHTEVILTITTIDTPYIDPHTLVGCGFKNTRMQSRFRLKLVVSAPSSSSPTKFVAAPTSQRARMPASPPSPLRLSGMSHSSSAPCLSPTSPLSPSASVPSLNFAGSLGAGFSYERQQHRLPPVDPEHLSFMSRRRLQANAAMIHRDVETAEVGEDLARRKAEKQAADLEAWSKVDARRETGVRTARRTLMQTHDVRINVSSRRAPSRGGGQGSAKSERQAIREAIRETARDCLRKDQLSKLREATRQATELASRRADLLEDQRQDEEHNVELRTRCEEAWLQRKLDFEEARLRGRLSNATEREAEKAVVEKQRVAHEEALREAWNARAAERDQRAQEKRAKAEAAGLAKEAADENRRKEKEAMRLIREANRAADLARSTEHVFLTTDALATKCQAEADHKINYMSLLQHAEDAPAEAEALGKLRKRLEVARARAVSSKRLLKEHRAAAAAAEKRAKDAVLQVKT